MKAKIIKMFRIIRTWFCDHEYGNGRPCPFTDEYGNHSAVYTCKKCGKQNLVTFYRR